MWNLDVRRLRRVLALDAVSGLAMAAAHLGFTEHLSSWLGLPETWIVRSAWVVCGAALLAGALSLRAEPPTVAVRTLAIVNFAWTFASLWAVWAGGFGLTGLGLAWIPLQAVFVLALGGLEWVGSARSPAAAPV